MAVGIPNGAKLFFSSKFAPEVKITSITNAATAVMTAKNHSLTKGDIILLSVPWGYMDNLVVRAGTVAGDTVELEGVDTTNQNIFFTGGGVGSFKKIIEWTWLSQLDSFETSGGEQQTIKVQHLEDEYEKELPTVKSAVTASITISHDSTLPFYKALQKLDETRETVAMRFYVPVANEHRYYSAAISFSDHVSSNKNETEKRMIKLFMQSQKTMYYKG